MTIICPECQTVNEENETFCKNCGINLVEAKSSDYDDAVENKWVRRLFYWQDERTHKYRLAKSKIISVIVYVIWIIYGIIYYFIISAGKYGFFVSIVAMIILAFILTFPVLLVSLLIHKLTS